MENSDDEEHSDGEAISNGKALLRWLNSNRCSKVNLILLRRKEAAKGSPAQEGNGYEIFDEGKGSTNIIDLDDEW